MKNFHGGVAIKIAISYGSYNVSETNMSELSFSIGSAAINTEFSLSFNNGECQIDALLGSNGSLTYTAVATGDGATNEECEQGAGI